jgi:hypothetical protein
MWQSVNFRQCPKLSINWCGVQYKCFNQHNKFNIRPASSSLQIVLCHVVVGMVHDPNRSISNHPVVLPESVCYSQLIESTVYSCHGLCLVYPEYIIIYRDKSNCRSRTNAAPKANLHVSAPSESTCSPDKLCVICMEHPVCFVTIVSTVMATIVNWTYFTRFLTCPSYFAPFQATVVCVPIANLHPSCKSLKINGKWVLILCTSHAMMPHFSLFDLLTVQNAEHSLLWQCTGECRRRVKKHKIMYCTLNSHVD